jgi:hypothetical protein
MLAELTQMHKLEPLQYETMAPLRKNCTASVHITAWKLVGFRSAMEL